MGLKGCKYFSLNTPDSQTPLSHSLSPFSLFSPQHVSVSQGYCRKLATSSQQRILSSIADGNFGFLITKIKQISISYHAATLQLESRFCNKLKLIPSSRLN